MDPAAPYGPPPVPRRRRVEVGVAAPVALASVVALGVLGLAGFGEFLTALFATDGGGPFNPPVRYWAYSVGVVLLQLIVCGYLLIRRSSRPFRSARTIAVACAALAATVMTSAWCVVEYAIRAHTWITTGP